MLFSEEQQSIMIIGEKLLQYASFRNVFELLPTQLTR
jgi:hypothetical protein